MPERFQCRAYHLGQKALYKYSSFPFFLTSTTTSSTTGSTVTAVYHSIDLSAGRIVLVVRLSHDRGSHLGRYARPTAIIDLQRHRTIIPGPQITRQSVFTARTRMIHLMSSRSTPTSLLRIYRTFSYNFEIIFHVPFDTG